MKYPLAIHKSIKYSAADIHTAIMELREIPGVYDGSYADGWIIVDDRPDVEDGMRNKSDYRIEWLELDENLEIISNGIE